ncbi:MAG: hypothetical protein IJC21_00035 [Lentisphaeria bacterium]|nr:hypothetical protein [Lentisphaeria bacterium]
MNEYPGIPADMTISIDANLNKSLRESCSQPINSTAEFRKLPAGKHLTPSPQKTKDKRQLPLKQILPTAVIIALLGALVFLFYQQKKMEAKHIPQSVQIDPEVEKQWQRLKNVDKDFQKKTQAEVQEFFKKSGWLDNGKMLPFLLDYEVIKRDDMQDLLHMSTGNPSIKPIHGAYCKEVRIVTFLETNLWKMLHNTNYPDFDIAKVQARQRYWKIRKGDPAKTQQEMLKTDHMMQAVALDSAIRNKINKILENGLFRDNEEAKLQKLLNLRQALLDPQWGKLQFMSKNLH